MKPRPANEHPDWRSRMPKYVKTWQDVAAYRDGARYDKQRAYRVIQFFSCLKHYKGKWAGQQFELLPWQKEIWRNVFGWIWPDGTRRFRRVIIYVPKKNGKSGQCAGIALYLLAPDGEPGAEVYSAAVDKNQAAIVFDDAMKMARESGLESVIKMIPSTRRMLFGNSVYRVIPCDSDRAEGLNIHGLIFDELHAQKNRKMFDALIYGGAARTQPLIVEISTAGADKNSIGYEEYSLAKKVMDGAYEAPSVYAVIYEADENDDWSAESTWRKANPSYGVTINRREMRAMADDARGFPSKIAAFKRYRLNIWASSENKWLDIDKWDACAEPGYIPSPDAECYAGLDLSATTDLTALVLAFREPDGRVVLVPHIYIPADTALRKEQSDQAPYTEWANKGHIHLIPGAVIDTDYVANDIEEMHMEYKIKKLAYDAWGSAALMQRLERLDIEVVKFRQGFRSMSQPTKEFEAAVIQHNMRHDGNPAMRFCVDNVVIVSDPAENIKPDKSKSTKRIDSAVAGIMAHAMAAIPSETESVYENERPFSL